MNSHRSPSTGLRLLATVLLLALTGCATTRINVTTPSGVKVSASFPKNMDAKDLKITFDPVKQVYRFEAATLKTDAAIVVKEKNVGLSALAGAVSDTAKAVAPAILP